MKPYFDTKEKIDALLKESASWLGTPWMANSAAKGKLGGVACHMLPTLIYQSIGALPESFPHVKGTPSFLRVSMKRAANETPGVMEKTIEGRSEFTSLNAGEDLIAGDMIGFRLFYEVDHLAVIIEPKQQIFIHVLVQKHTCYDSLLDPSWKSRKLRSWRIYQ